MYMYMYMYIYLVLKIISFKGATQCHPNSIHFHLDMPPSRDRGPDKARQGEHEHHHREEEDEVHRALGDAAHTKMQPSRIENVEIS